MLANEKWAKEAEHSSLLDLFQINGVQWHLGESVGGCVDDMVDLAGLLKELDDVLLKFAFIAEVAYMP